MCKHLQIFCKQRKGEKTMKKLLTMSTTLLLAAVSLGLVSCGGSNDPTSSNAPTSGGTPTPSTSGGSGNTSSGGQQETGIFETASIKDDATLDDDGNAVFDEEVRIKMWSIIGDPDQVTFQKIVDKFNEDYLGQIRIDLVYQGHFDYYTALDTTWTNDRESFPDVCFMHNEKTIEYANKGYLYPMDTLFEKAGVSFDFSQVYENIDRVTKYQNHRFAVPVDAHGFLTSIRQDIIKKNGLGFDGNTRFIPNSRDEYQTLLENLRNKADAGELLIRDIRRGQDHSWKKADKKTFFPSYSQSTDPDGLSALYANGGNLVNEKQDTITFNQNQGFVNYVTDQVDRWNDRLVGESGTNQEMFAEGRTVLFTEGPWWASNTFAPTWNNSELKNSSSTGVSEEDANDPVINTPFAASRPTGWWTLPENASNETANKWYGNGHAISVTRHCNSMQKISAALTFMKYYTQAVNEKGVHNLTTWCSAGHIPAWKNVYESQDYQDMLSKNITCQALGNPADIVAMEGLVFETTIFNAVADSVALVQNELRSANGCTKERAIEIIENTVFSAQFMLDTLIDQNK